MFDFLIQSQDSIEGQSIKDLLKDYGWSSTVSYGKNSTLTHLLHDGPSIFILDCTQVNPAVIDYVKELKARGFKGGTILLVDHSDSHYDELSELKRVHVVEKTSLEINLIKLIKKLVGDLNSEPQFFRRYSTYQNLKIESMHDGRDMESYMTNLSLGGACCIFTDDPSLQEGDLVRLKIRLSDINKSHNVSAQVVWHQKDKNTGRVGLGLQFIKEQDMYKKLIENL